MHASASPAYFVPLQRSASVSLSRAPRERGLGYGVCGRVATVHNTSPSSLGTGTPREMLTMRQADAQSFRWNLLEEARRRSREKSSRRNKLRASQETLLERRRRPSKDHRQTAASLLQKGSSTSKAKYHNPNISTPYPSKLK